MLVADAAAEDHRHRPMSLNLDRPDIKRARSEINGREVMVHPLVWRETESATEINRILNDPSVFPLISVPDQSPIDATDLVRDPRYVFLMSEGGVIIFVPDVEPTSGLYEVHINFLDGHRGADALEVVRAALRWIFTRTTAMTLVTRVPIFNRAAEAMCWAIHGQLWFVRPAVWPTKDGPVDLKFYRLSIDDWMRRCKALGETGKEFHRHLESEYARHGFVHEPHPDDDSHDHAVGAAVEMIYGGEPEKAAILYNRWARIAGYRMMNLISKNPLVIDIGESLLHVTGQNFRVIQCRSAQP
jgi:hypothetical protein